MCMPYNDVFRIDAFQVSVNMKWVFIRDDSPKREYALTFFLGFWPEQIYFVSVSQTPENFE